MVTPFKQIYNCWGHNCNNGAIFNPQTNFSDFFVPFVPSRDGLVVQQGLALRHFLVTPGRAGSARSWTSGDDLETRC